MLGCDGEVTDSPAEWSDRLHPGDRAMFLKRFDDHCRGLSEGLNVECRMRHHEGHYRWFLSRGLAVRGPNGVAMRIAGSLTDVTQGKTTDPLTNLPNRLRLEEKLEEALEHAQRDGGNFAVLFIDLDRFKIVNDSLGHLAGDIMIREVARRLEAGIRTRDDTVARFGGDEFGVVLDRLENRDDAEIVARRIQELIAQPLLLSGQKLFPSASIGVAIGGPTSIAEDVLRNADTAMYHAKALGKGTFSVFQDQMRERAISRMEIECDMRTALEKQQFEAFFQPKVELRTGQLRGFEALARWRHPTRGMVSPAEFIPIAEDAELIAELGERILRLACERLAAWEKSYPIDPPLLMSVNLSTRELTAGDVVGRIRRVIEETGVQSEHVSMELTESAMAQNSDAAESLARLKALGLGLKVDDFGTGYSSLSYLHSFPFDTLKIDQSFVRRLTLDRETPEIVRTIIVLAQSLGLGVVAEGVETEEQRQKLLQLGCEYAQGFLFSRPVDAASAEALVKARFEAQVKV
jgi:diguanylate cyclase (GGDEF)-like protein